MIVDGLGRSRQRWAILRNGYKPYPCGFVSHAMIEAVRSLRARRGSSDGLRRLVLRVSPESTQLMGNPDPRNELEAKFSLVYEAAVAWLDGNVTPAAFEAATVQDRRYRGVMSVVEIVVSETIRQDEAFAEGTFADGTSEVVHVEHAKGTSIRPMTDADVLDKFSAALAMGGIADGRALYEVIMTATDAPAAVILDQLAKVPAQSSRPAYLPAVCGNSDLMILNLEMSTVASMCRKIAASRNSFSTPKSSMMPLPPCNSMQCVATFMISSDA